MRLFLDICTGAGLSASAGVRPFLPALAAGAFAGLNLGVDYDHTDYAFLQSGWFLLAVLLALAAVAVVQRLRGAAAVETGPLGAALGGIGIALGALLFAAALADHGYPSWPGLVAGVGAALLGQVAARNLFGRVRARSERAVQESLVVFADLSALVGAIVAMLVPPISILLLGFLGWLLVGGRRRAGEKYAGLRILR